MAKATEILARIDEKAPYAMVIEASVRDYCVLALQFLKGQVQPQPYFQSPLPAPLSVLDTEASALKHAAERYCVQLYKPSSEALLAAPSQTLPLPSPSGSPLQNRHRPRPTTASARAYI